MTLQMDDKIYVFLNGAVASTSLLITFFFCSCLLLPKSGQEEAIKQPLLLLLWSVVGWNGFVQFTILLSVCLTFSKINMDLGFVIGIQILLFLSIFLNLSPPAWLSVFYHIRIVPAQRAFFIWMKRNLKPVVYWGLAIDRVLILCDNIIRFKLVLSLNDKRLKVQNGNFTSALLNDSEASEINEVIIVVVCIDVFYFIICLIVMTSSSCATVLYLWKHMKTMQATPSSSFSSPHLQSQWRVTITGITQAGLSIFSLLCIILHYFLPELVEFDILCTVISFFSLGTMINFGFGQTLFRQRAADLWNRAVQSTQLCGFNRA